MADPGNGPPNGAAQAPPSITCKCKVGRCSQCLKCRRCECDHDGIPIAVKLARKGGGRRGKAPAAAAGAAQTRGLPYLVGMYTEAASDEDLTEQKDEEVVLDTGLSGKAALVRLLELVHATPKQYDVERLRFTLTKQHCEDTEQQDEWRRLRRVA